MLLLMQWKRTQHIPLLLTVWALNTPLPLLQAPTWRIFASLRTIYLFPLGQLGEEEHELLESSFLTHSQGEPSEKLVPFSPE